MSSRDLHIASCLHAISLLRPQNRVLSRLRDPEFEDRLSWNPDLLLLRTFLDLRTLPVASHRYPRAARERPSNVSTATLPKAVASSTGISRLVRTLIVATGSTGQDEVILVESTPTVVLIDR
jgi:hypothetical protein